MAYESATHDGMTVESSSETADQIRESFAAPDDVTVETTREPADPVLGDDLPPVETEAPAVEAKPKPRNDPRARVEQATAKEAEAKRERDAVKAENQRLAARISELEARSRPEPVQPSKPAVEDVEPTVEQFDSYEKFVKAQARWEARQEIRRQETERQQHTVQQQREYQIREVDRQFGERYSAVLSEDPEFPSRVDPRLLTTPRAGVLADPNEATLGNLLVEQVFHSEHPKEMLLHLSNPTELQRLATLPPGQVIRELAKFEARLGAASPRGPAPVVPPISRAKPPIQPLGTSHVTASGEPPGDEDSYEKHAAFYNNLDRKARRG